jgi:N-acetylneuraminic acid mutarotase
MNKKLLLLFLLAALGAYLYYVRGWDLKRAKEEAVNQVSFFKDESATTTPVGSRGTGTHWESASRLLVPRGELGAARIEGRIYVIGGMDGYGRTLSDVEMYDVEKDSWSYARRLPQALHHTAVTTDGRKVYAVGGQFGLSHQAIDGAFAYDPTVNEWAELGRMNDFRSAAAAAVVNDVLYVVGGVDQAGPTGKLERYDAAEGKWIELASMPTPREHLAAVALSGRLYAIGGRKGASSENLDIVESYDPMTGKWQREESLTLKRGGFSAVVLDDKIYVFGGETPDGTIEAVEVFEGKPRKWRQIPQAMPAPRHGLAAVPYLNRVYVIGGGKRPGFAVSDLNEVLVFGK